MCYHTSAIPLGSTSSSYSIGDLDDIDEYWKYPEPFRLLFFIYYYYSFISSLFIYNILRLTVYIRIAEQDRPIERDVPLYLNHNPQSVFPQLACSDKEEIGNFSIMVLFSDTILFSVFIDIIFICRLYSKDARSNGQHRRRKFYPPAHVGAVGNFARCIRTG